MKKSKQHNRLIVILLWIVIAAAVITTPISIVTHIQPYVLNLPQDNSKEIPVFDKVLLSASGVTFRNGEYFELQNIETQEVIQPEYISKSADVSQPYFVIRQVPAGSYQIISARRFTYLSSETSISVTIIMNGVEKGILILCAVSMAMIIIVSSLSLIFERR